ncbi:MAG TPA: hypothetical protein VE861_10705 [Gemmatimonadaceae bacterium]|nr:hypothetical protein [Gemmatimonadaceae bacterium]
MIAQPLRRAAIAAAASLFTSGFAIDALVAQAAAPEPNVLPPVAGISMQGGTIGFQSGAFNAQLASQGRGLLEKNVYTLGVESWVRWDRVMLLAGSHTYLPTRAIATNYTTETEGAYGQLDVGVPIIIARRTLVYPLAGVGLSTSTITLRRNGEVDFNANFRDISSIGGRNVDITARRYQGHVGVGLDRVFTPPWPKLLMTFGIRAGYMTTLGDTKWRSGPERVNGAPELGLEGGYVRLTLGGVLGKRRYAAVPMVGSLLPYIGR